MTSRSATIQGLLSAKKSRQLGAARASGGLPAARMRATDTRTRAIRLTPSDIEVAECRTTKSKRKSRATTTTPTNACPRKRIAVAVVSGSSSVSARCFCQATRSKRSASSPASIARTACASLNHPFCDSGMQNGQPAHKDAAPWSAALHPARLSKRTSSARRIASLANVEPCVVFKAVALPAV